ncbi:hypothetical protein FF38_10350 [Lucilia cuprina]|uniref:Uncharacterized protein n=1 Tax=Lucilia cuprina TaxID=7375 RepID=A0A0L0CHG8_LUCCU|nr:hypothetical protein FF38_10350 [Lucilia cuprina]
MVAFFNFASNSETTGRIWLETHLSVWGQGQNCCLYFNFALNSETTGRIWLETHLSDYCIILRLGANLSKMIDAASPSSVTTIKTPGFKEPRTEDDF